MDLARRGNEIIDTSVKYRLMMGNTDVCACLEYIRQEKIRKAMRNYELDDLSKDAFLDEILAIEREYQEKIEKYNKIFEYAFSFEKTKKENDK